MACPLQPEGDDEVVGSMGVIKKVEFVRIIANALYSLGYKTSGARLEEESGIPLHSSVVRLFTQQVLDGLWDSSIITLQKIGLIDDSIVKSGSFLILEQKFFELLQEEKILDALVTLRTGISALGIKNGRIRELSTFIISHSLKNGVGSPSPSQNSIWVKSKLLEELHKLLPPSIMIPARRLELLVEQALKRMKVSLGEPRGLSNGSSVIVPTIGFSRDSMACPLQPEVDDEVVGSIGVIKKVEFVRIIANALYSLGYKTSGARLEEESGIPLYSSVVRLFTQQVLDGLWDSSIITLQKIGLIDDSIVKSGSFLILEQKFFELLQEEKVLDALMMLRTEISALGIKNGRIRELSTFIISHSLKTGVDSPSPSQKVKSKLLEELQKLLPPSIMIPARRLEFLVEQALFSQIDACTFHNSFKTEMSLYTDHNCGKNQIPSKTTQILEAHKDEVWFLQFSHDGRYLASASCDQSAIIWEVCFNGEVTLKHRLSSHGRPVSSLSWSPDDRHLLTCGWEEAVRMWDVSTGRCLRVYGKRDLGLVNCGWFPDGKVIVTGDNNKSICMWGIDGIELEWWKEQDFFSWIEQESWIGLEQESWIEQESWSEQRTLKISDLEVTNDGKKIISIDGEKDILLLDRETKMKKWISEERTITSFHLSNDSKFLLVNLVDQEIHLWNIEGEIELVATYTGHKPTQFVIRSCFGGIKQSFLVSGSEDSLVYIWHRESRELITALSGHSGSVNCVSWNPANPHMLGSGSDDRTIRIWGL